MASKTFASDKVPKKPRVYKKKTEEAPSTELILEGINVAAIDNDIFATNVPNLLTSSSSMSVNKNNVTLIENITKKLSPNDTICWGETYKIDLYRNGSIIDTKQIKCSWCHQYPKGIMLSVPYAYVPHYIQENVYSPECINMVTELSVSTSSLINEPKGPVDQKKYKSKTILKSNCFKRDIIDTKAYNDNDPRLVINGYFKTAEFVCSFNCMKPKAKELALTNPVFKNAYVYITQLYSMIFDVDICDVNIVDMPHFTMFQDYGGVLNREQYLKNTQIIEVSNSGQYDDKITVRSLNVISSSEQ